MQTSVDLQKPFEYSVVLGIILLALVLLPILIWGIYKLINFKPKKKEKKAPKAKPVVVKKDAPIVIKNRYIAYIAEVENDLKSGKIDERESYIRLSSIVRNFVHEMTDIDVQNFTLIEIDKLGMSQLTSLIGKFYRPEFSYEDQYNEINQAFVDARSVVSQWR